MQHRAAPPSSPTIRNQVDKPQGVLPRKSQQYIILGIATLIVLIALFSSHGGAKAHATQAAGVSDPTAPSASEINAYEQQLQQLQQAAQGGVKPSGGSAGAARLREQQLTMQGALRTQPSDPPAPDPIRQQEEKLAYESLFASNIALSYRQTPDRGHPLLGSPTVAVGESDPAVATPTQPAQPKAATQQVEPAAASYVLPEGSILPTVLLNRLNGDFAGPVECMVTSDVYSPDRQRVLIPAGSKVFGDAKPVSGLGQRRLAVRFHRLLLPDGASFTLDTAPGLDQAGATALHDKVNNHYFQIFGVSAALGILGAAAEIGESPNIAAGRVLFLQGVGNGMSQASMQVLDRFLNIMPTVTIREGHRVDIYLMHNLVLPAYQSQAPETPIGGGLQP